MQDSRGTWQHGQLLRPPTGISSEPLIKTFHVTLKAQQPSRGSPDEGGLPSRVLAHQQDHGLVVEISILQGRRVELMEAVIFFQGQQLTLVEFLEPVTDSLEDLGVLLAAIIATQPAEHRGSWGKAPRSGTRLGRVAAATSPEHRAQMHHGPGCPTCWTQPSPCFIRSRVGEQDAVS